MDYDTLYVAIDYGQRAYYKDGMVYVDSEGYYHGPWPDEYGY